ncbi:MAG: DUF448 domain-containing protein [Pseudomonadota bacterium]
MRVHESAAEEGDPRRRCILTRRSLPKSALLRLVADPEGKLAPDLEGRLPGRGVWVSLDGAVLAAAVESGALLRQAARGLKVGQGRLIVAPDFAARLDSLLAQRALRRLGLERRAGRVALGFEKVRALIGAPTLALVVIAADAGADGKAKIGDTAMRRGVPVARIFGRAELSLALGRENVVHAALTHGPATARLIAELDRLARYRGVCLVTGAEKEGVRTQ